MYPNNRKPMAHRDIEELDRDDYRTSKEPTPSGDQVEVTRFKDGTSRVNWGGPCGSSCYDANGEEC